MAKPVLGRGLGALLGGVSAAAAKASPFSSQPPAPAPAAPADQRNMVLTIAVNRIRPCSFQPRKAFTEETLRELADSIKEKGIVQPLIVRQNGDNFELIAGERRWRAAQLAGLTELPVIVRKADDRDLLELALIENLQRENLNPIEEALGYGELVTRYSLTQEEVAGKVGKSRAVVANALRLLKLASDIQAHVRDGRISVGHAKVILGLTSFEHQQLAADRVIRDALSVRQTEELVGVLQNPSTPSTSGTGTKRATANRDAHVMDVENKLQEKFGTKVSLRYKKGKGSVEIKFFSDDDLERILSITGVKVD
ncbi:MAG: ParB/RepB/Spo0J family partition protein [Verrucomicrobia bacterium]|nr:ParB/RepB/Spo0J family partition protein [Verrucomicrobiota bacterium]